ncbi:type 1 glutamine amidotransferase [Candidatus Micrarchaeota archaeon]|nr:type 1 glutamine amidotransferase [Candidatus Micrarchaeota archaeon]
MSIKMIFMNKKKNKTSANSPKKSLPKKSFSKIGILNCYDKLELRTYEFNGKKVNEVELLSSRIESFSGVSTQIFNICFEEFPETDCDAYIISGSLYNPDRKTISENKWIRDLLSFIRKTHEKRIPQLGICFGHQMIAVAFGGRPFKLHEWEIGFRKIVLKEAGKKESLFHSVNEIFWGIFIHGWGIYRTSLPFGSRLLALSPEIPEQAAAFSIGETTYALQFHPERTAEDITIMAELYKDKISKDVEIDDEKSSDDNVKILENFVNIVKKRKPR